MVRARAVLDLAEALDADLERRGGTSCCATSSCRSSGARRLRAHRHRRRRRAPEALEARLGDEVVRPRPEAYAAVGHEFHLGSPKQLQALLFDELGLPKTKKIKTGYTTDADALQNLLGTHPVIEALLLHREITRLLMVVEKQLLPTVADDGRIHTTFKQMVAATGRLSSDNPNLQNVPIRTAQGREIRQGFVAGPGFEALMTADYSQIEMRIMAHLSEDAGLIEAFTTGEDLHTFVASARSACRPEQVDPELRRRIKAMSYGLAYGLSAFGLAQQLRITPDEAKEQMEAYFERFGGVRDYLRDVVDAGPQGRLHRDDPRPASLPARPHQRQRAAPADGRADGAQRPDPGQRRRHHQDRDARRRPGAARRGPAVSRLLLQVHDELVLEVAPGEREALEALVRKEMGEAYPLSVPLDVSVGVGRTWDDAGH